MYQCFHCMKNSVVWCADYGFDDCGYEGEGIVHFCRCANCGAEIEYRIPDEPEQTEEPNKMTIYDFIGDEKNENTNKQTISNNDGRN